VQALPRLRRREANTTSYVSDYLTRSVRRASGFVLVVHPEVIETRLQGSIPNDSKSTSEILARVEALTGGSWKVSLERLRPSHY